MNLRGVAWIDEQHYTTEADKHEVKKKFGRQTGKGKGDDNDALEGEREMGNNDEPRNDNNAQQLCQCKCASGKAKQMTAGKNYVTFQWHFGTMVVDASTGDWDFMHSNLCNHCQYTSHSSDQRRGDDIDAGDDGYAGDVYPGGGGIDDGGDVYAGDVYELLSWRW